MSGRRFSGASLLLVALAASAASCNRSVDIKEAIEVVDASSGWYDAGIVDGKNKIVPSVTFSLKKKPDADLSGVALNVVFRHPCRRQAATSRKTGRTSSSSAPSSRAANETDPLVVRLRKGLYRRASTKPARDAEEQSVPRRPRTHLRQVQLLPVGGDWRRGRAAAAARAVSFRSVPHLHGLFARADSSRVIR